MAFSASDISKASVLGVIFIVTVLGNALVAYILVKNYKRLLKNRPTYQFILNIVVSDLLVGLLTIPFEFTRELLGNWVFQQGLCKIIEYFEIAVSGTAVYTHALIAYDRYRSLARPYLPKLEGKRVKKMIAVSWLVPTLVAAPYLYMFEVKEIPSMAKIICTPKALPISWLDKLYEAVEFLFVLFLPFIVLCWCYFHVTLMMWGRSPMVAADSFPATPHSVIHRTRKRVTRTAGLVAATFTVCWLPTFVLSCVRIVSGTESIHRGHVLYETAMFGTFINEAITPIIYCAFDRSLRARITYRAICTYLSESSGSSVHVNETINSVTQNTAADMTRKREKLRKLEFNAELNHERCSERLKNLKDETRLQSC
ncbi:substance-P receptor-like [Stylophora pistillata]|uniref:substance-P receptor-like n=1 Tax=Stylophora pistillata TaxID=50429 RepID=UPI000C04700B|nr:substance-P receptor-like [Stylophora pistillata]